MPMKLKTSRRVEPCVPPKSGFAVLLLLAFLASCGGPQTKPALEYMPDMADGPSVKAQEAVGRTPPAGTHPVGSAYYPYTQAQGDEAGSALKNPAAMDRETLLKGKKGYDTYCIVCHGPSGKGNGFIVPKFPMPPSLHSEKVSQWPDARIFHVITTGQNLMPSYAYQIPAEERWAIIQYVRALERSVKPTPEDVEAFQKAIKEGN